MSQRVVVAPSLVDEAADWLMRLHAGELDADGQHALDAWCQRSDEHRRVWIAAQQLAQTFERVPSSIGMPVLQRQKLHRRTIVRSLALMSVAGPAGWLTVQQWPVWRAAWRTGVGERKEIVLADGSRLTLNTDSAVDLLADGSSIALQLHAGEIFVDATGVAKPVQKRVTTPHGFVAGREGRFSVRLHGKQSEAIAVEQGIAFAPRRSRSTETHELLAGQRVLFNADMLRIDTSASDASAWLRGELIAEEMRLDKFIGELSRYRPGLLRCDPAVAARRISGVFQLDDTDRVLSVVKQTLSIAVHYRTRYWVTISAA